MADSKKSYKNICVCVCKQQREKAIICVTLLLYELEFSMIKSERAGERVSECWSWDHNRMKHLEFKRSRQHTNNSRIFETRSLELYFECCLNQKQSPSVVFLLKIASSDRLIVWSTQSIIYENPNSETWNKQFTKKQNISQPIEMVWCFLMLAGDRTLKT